MGVGLEFSVFCFGMFRGVSVCVCVCLWCLWCLFGYWAIAVDCFVIVLLLSCFISSGVLGSHGLLLSCSMITAPCASPPY